jgi:hypothetical protein
VTYDDITVGLQALLVCIEALAVMLSFYFFFHSNEYHKDKSALSVYSPAQALIHALNPIDLIRGIGLAFGGFGPARVNQAGSV